MATTAVIDEERFLFYAAASRAEELVVLSFRSSDEEGNPEQPSVLVDEVRRLFAPALWERRTIRTLAQLTWPEDAAPSQRERARARAAAGPRSEPPGIGDLQTVAAREALRHRSVVSAGTLEAYAACPVKWLVEKELEPESLAPDPDAIARGDFVHRVLERTLRALRDSRGSARIDANSLPEAERLLADAIDAERSRRPVAVGKTAAAGAARKAADDLRSYLHHAAGIDTGHEPRELELRFGMDDEGLPALELGGGALRVRGVIDRVDIDAHGTAVVLDYKSGLQSGSWAAAKWADEQRLQVALYMLAVRDLLGLRPVAGLYQPMRGELRARGALERSPAVEQLTGPAFVRTDVLDPEQLAELLETAETAALALADGIRAGRLRPQPATCAWGGGCQFPGICRSVRT